MKLKLKNKRELPKITSQNLLFYNIKYVILVKELRKLKILQKTTKNVLTF